jgi:Zn-dependent protease/CBS domain-containing protein
MTATWRIGKIWGIPIGFHWSLLLVFGLLVVSLAQSFFPSTHPDLADGAYIIMAVVSALLFFLSILLHELGHAWVAQRNDLPVVSITLFIFGGVAQISGRAPSAGVELRVAAAGPAVSFALAAIFGVIAWIAEDVAYITAPLGWLAGLNLVLALFNLLPGFPLDGGRILRALAWQKTGSERRAADVARVSGQVVAFGMMGLGAFLAFTGPISTGLWLIVIGWFLQNAANSEVTATRLDLTLRGLTVDRIMGPMEPAVPGSMRLRQLLDDVALPSPYRHFLVIDDGVPRGVVSLDDVAKAPQDRLDWIAVTEVMTPWSRTAIVQHDTPVRDALATMERANASYLPVMEGGQVSGILTKEEVMDYLRHHIDARTR